MRARRSGRAAPPQRVRRRLRAGACQQHEPDPAFVSKCIASPSGGTLLDELKAHPEIYSTAVILVAPEEMPFEQAQYLLARGATDMIVELVTAAGVLARVRAAARTKKPQEELVGQGRRLMTMLHEDPLTGLFNRRYVLTRLGRLRTASAPRTSSAGS